MDDGINSQNQNIATDQQGDTPVDPIDNPAITPDATASANTISSSSIDLPEVIDEYQKRLFSEIGSDNWSEEEKADVKEKISTLVNDRILNLLLIFLPDEKVAELDEIITSGNQNLIFKFLSDNIPDIGEKIANELMDIRADIINKFKK